MANDENDLEEESNDARKLTSESARIHYHDQYSIYEEAISEYWSDASRIPSDIQILILRLNESIRATRLYGKSTNLSAEISSILSILNQMTTDLYEVSFMIFLEKMQQKPSRQAYKNQTIFISHSHDDEQWSLHFVKALADKGYDVWYDKTSLRGGLRWIETIEKELQSRDTFIIILTPAAWASRWVRDELYLAMRQEKRIIPILLKSTMLTGFILNMQYIEAENKDGLTVADSIENLLNET